MTEQNNHNDPFEELFRKKSREYDISFREEDWQKLEQRLDRQEAKVNRRKRLGWIAAAVILLFSLLGYFTYQNYLAIDQLNDKLSEETTPEPPENMIEERPANIGDQSQQQETEPEEEDISSSKENNTPRSTAGITENRGTETRNNTVNQQTPASLNATNVEALNLFTNQIPCEECLLLSSRKYNLAPNQFPLADASVLSSNNEPASASSSLPPVSPDVMGESTTSTSITSPVSIGILAGPDLSTVGSISNFTEPGFKLGLTIEYRIGKNFAINAGVARANVNYLANGNEYKPPYGYWTNGIVADETVAKCGILEIPINLKYNLLDFNHSRIYTSGGLSSYIMLNEEYRFNYDQNASGLVRSWNGETGSRHWMSNATIAIGYEIDLMNHWSLRAEPFVKLPLKEVGWGNVKLYSVGSSVSLNFNL